MSGNLLEVSIRHSLHTAGGVMPMEVNCSITAGIIALTGASGAGKTTLLKQIAGLATPTEGRISFGGTNWLDTERKIHIPVQQRNIGFVFQDYALFPNMTVRQNLHFALPKNGDPQLTDHLLDTTGLTQLSDRLPFQLSGGQQQRVALARALVRRPSLLLLDEPFNALDQEMRRHLQDLLLKFQSEFQFTAVIVTHDASEIFRLADQVLVMETGKILHSGTPAEVYFPKNVGEAQMQWFGEVVSAEQNDSGWLVQAWVDHRIRRFQIPPQKLPFVTGSRFLMRYQNGAIEIDWM